MKKHIGEVEAQPSKRLFISIIADYDLNRALCELIDNALDQWVIAGSDADLKVHIDLETNQQTITVTDNAGGVRESDLSLLVGPGQTANDPTQELIGFFGVGTKRAVVALSQEIRIESRHDTDRTVAIEFDDHWLETDSWQLPKYQVDPLPPGTTRVVLQRLRFTVTDEAVSQLVHHLGATYAPFLRGGKVSMSVGTESVEPVTFDNWAYPPTYEPRRYTGIIHGADGGTVHVDATAGLVRESRPAAGEYGVYVYCNQRLVARALKSYEVGFAKGLAGQPHPDLSLARVLVTLRGPAELMPWNSSKSGINANHTTFRALQGWPVQVVKDYSSLSRRLSGAWTTAVFPYDSGEIIREPISDFPTANKSYLPPLPVTRPRYGDRVASLNKLLTADKPWTVGLYEGVAAVDLISRQKYRQRNRISLIVLDSILEIGFKEFLVHETGHRYSEAKLANLFQNRIDVHTEVKNYSSISGVVWGKIEYYYDLRRKLIHERATAGLDDEELSDFREVVEGVFSDLFGLVFE